MQIMTCWRRRRKERPGQNAVNLERPVSAEYKWQERTYHLPHRVIAHNIHGKGPSSRPPAWNPEGTNPTLLLPHHIHGHRSITSTLYLNTVVAAFILLMLYNQAVPHTTTAHMLTRHQCCSAFLLMKIQAILRTHGCHGVSAL